MNTENKKEWLSSWNPIRNEIENIYVGTNQVRPFQSCKREHQREYHRKNRQLKSEFYRNERW